MAKILNDSLNQTLTRTIISNGTTFLAVLGLFLFGGEVLRGFGFAMVVGHHRGDLLDALHRGAARELVVRRGRSRAGAPVRRRRPEGAARLDVVSPPRGNSASGTERQPYPGTPRRQQHCGGLRRRGSAPRAGC